MANCGCGITELIVTSIFLLTFGFGHVLLKDCAS
jgi:hypothetical protein